jgi:hypothetical protein
MGFTIGGTTSCGGMRSTDGPAAGKREDDMRGPGRAIGVAVMVIAGLWAVAPTAQATDQDLGTVSRLTYMQDFTGNLVAPAVGTADAACPAGTQVVGGGASPLATDVQTPEFWVNRSAPYDGADADLEPDDGWIGQGFNRFGEDKILGVSAICFAGNVAYASDSASAAAGSEATAKVACPPGTHVAGGGASIDPSARNAYLNSSYPYDNADAGSRPDDGWTARAFNLRGFTKHVHVDVECIAPTPIYPSRGGSGFSFEVFFTNCPSSTHLTSPGGFIGGPASHGFVTGLFPFAGATNPPDRSSGFAFHRIASEPIVTDYAVCKI